MIVVYTDGASSGNPGASGAGVYIKTGENRYEYSIPLGVMTNHEAEFHAVIAALKICEQNFPNEILSFRSDSQAVVHAVDNNFTKNKTFLPLVESIQEKANQFPYFFIKWIPEKENSNADRLARKAIIRN